MIVETSALGICVVVFISVFIFLLILGAGMGHLPDGLMAVAIISISFLVFIMCWTTVKTHTMPASVVARGLVGNHVVFVVSGELKSYNDIDTLKNIDTIAFRRVQSINVFGYNIGESVERIK